MSGKFWRHWAIATTVLFVLHATGIVHIHLENVNLEMALDWGQDGATVIVAVIAAVTAWRRYKEGGEKHVE